MTGIDSVGDTVKTDEPFIAVYNIGTSSFTNADSLGSDDVDDVSFSPDGKRVAMMLKPSSRDPQSIGIFDFNSHQMNSYAIPQLQQATLGWIRTIDWSKDGTSLYIAADINEGQTDILKVDIASGAVSQLAPNPGEFWSIRMAFRSRDIGEH